MVPDAEEAHNKIDITVEEFIKELFEISNNFIDYKRGLVVLPNANKRKQYQSQLEECTFKPTINPFSIKIDQASS